jgi:hypothetical protein
MKNHNVCIPNLLPLCTLFAGHHKKFCVYPAFVSIVTKRVSKYRQKQPIYVIYLNVATCLEVIWSLQAINMKLKKLL